MTRFTTFAAACSAAALFATGAIAAEPVRASVGGFMHIGVGLTDVAGDSDDGGKVGILRDGEIHVIIKGTADNGLTFDGRVELEAATDSKDQIDENWARVSGTFGALMIGGNDSVKTEMAVGILYSPGTKVGYYDDDLLQGIGAEVDESGDGIGVHYYSPVIYGFSGGATYIADLGADGPGDTQYAQPGLSAHALALRYNGGYGAATYAFAGGWLSKETATGTQETFSFGGRGVISGFTLAAYWEKNFDETDDYAIGAAYKTGPWTFAGGYSLGGVAGAPDVDTVSGWATYALAPGVGASAGGAYADNGEESAYNAMAWMSLIF